MLYLSLRMVLWDLGRRKGRTVLMVFIFAAAITCYAVIGAVVDEMRLRVSAVWRSESPYDVIIRSRDAATPGNLARVKNLRGVMLVEQAVSLDVVLGYEQTTVLVPPEKSAIVFIEMENGVLPSNPQEIALPKQIASRFGWQEGDSVKLMASGSINAVDYTVSGVMAQKAGVPPVPILAMSGVSRLGYMDNAPNSLLIMLDGTADIIQVCDTLRKMWPAAQVISYEEQYERMLRSTTLADSMALSLRSMILIVASAAVASMLYLSQRERASESAVLRAMGLQGGWLLVILLLNCCAVATIGFTLGGGILAVIAPRLGISNRDVLAGRLLQDVAVLWLVALGVCSFVALLFARSPICTLMKDRWGKA